MKGNFGKYAYVDLTLNEVKDYIIPDKWYKKYIGGRGIAARILLEELDPKVDPMSAENMLVFASGPFQGTGIAGESRFLITGKSPKTKNINDSFCGGKFGHILGKSGFDGIIIKGKAKKPVYLSVNNGKVQIMPADDLWGFDPKQVEEKIGENLSKFSVACIGRAGENLVMQSCIIVDKSRALGRPGYGAIMGSKKLKAVVIRGNKNKELADEEKFKKLRKEINKKIANSEGLKGMGLFGTSGGVEYLSNMGMLPTKNFQDGQYNYAKKISGQELVKSKFWVKSETCPGCPVGCKRVVQGSWNGESFEMDWGGPEYETIAAFGSNLLNYDLESICLFSKKCNQYGLDTISVGVQIAYLMEATEKGLLKNEDQIKWGDTKAISKLIDKIANREGIGDWIARGVEYITEKVGDGSFLVHAKGQEVPMHDPRGKYSMAVYYATIPRGGNHMAGIHEPTPPHKELNLPENPIHTWKNRAKIAGDYLLLRSFANSLITCALISGLADNNDYLFPLFREILAAITGQEIDVKEMLTIGERNYDMTRIFAEKAGYTRADDKLPQRFHEAQPSTGFIVNKGKLEDTIDEYYKLYGYGIYGPDKDKQKELKIEI